MQSFLTDSILIANPAISDDPRFEALAGRAVYIVHHDDKGAVGVCLNRNYSKSIGELSETFPPLALVDESTLLSPKPLVGGPVMPDLPWILTSSAADHEKQIKNGSLALHHSAEAFSAHNNATASAVCGLGTFGWGPGQLDNEITNFLWHWIPANAWALSSLEFSANHQGAFNLLAMLKYSDKS